MVAVVNTSSQASLQMGSLAPMSFNAPRGILMFSRMCLSRDDAASKRRGADSAAWAPYSEYLID